MKVKILMAALAVTLMLGVRGYANPCDSACVDPCASCDQCAVRGDLFTGLKKLVNGVRIANHCDPCNAVVACNPCDEVACDPCDTACDLPRLGLGGRLRNLIASPSLCNPCDGASNCFDTDCKPCDAANCDPCGADSCGTGCLKLRSLNPFKGLLNRGCFADCDPCNAAANCFDGSCDPCNNAANCSDGCGDYCGGPRGHLLDLPRISLSKLFEKACVARCDASDCNPCDNVRPCNGVFCR